MKGLFLENVFEKTLVHIESMRAQNDKREGKRETKGVGMPELRTLP
jgi:hypothetical protein|tara:strand:+ start:1076 stop:1213 length:138 start_codon:yes stop_codon:yes gene_type:complete